jgi:NAD(P)-dependent dehydrogenase (short-subunit alcohol dehydrogenase family)
MAEAALSDPEIAARLQRDYPLGLGRPDDVAAAVAFLMSEDARWISGQEVVVDGGRTTNMSLK